MAHLVEITTPMLEAGRAEFRKWLQRWDYLTEGTPSQPYIDGALCRIFCSMLGRHEVDALKVGNEAVVVLPKLVGDFDEFTKEVIRLGGI